MAVQIRRPDRVQVSHLLERRSTQAGSAAIELVARCFAIGMAVGLLLESGARGEAVSVAGIGIVALAVALISWDR